MAADLPNRDKLDIQLSKSELLQSSNRADLVSEFLNSAAYSGLQAPVQAAAQIVDKIAGTKTESAVNIATAPQKAETLSGHWLAQEAGAAIGMLPWYLALHKGVSTLMEKSVIAPTAMKLAAEGKTLSGAQAIQANLFRASEAGVSGLLLGAGLTPVEQNDPRGFWQARRDHALSSAAAFSTLSLSSSMLGLASQRIAPYSSRLAGIVGSNTFTGAVAGIPAGFASTNLESALAGKGWASKDDNARAILGFFILGGIFGNAGDRLGLSRFSAAQESRDSAPTAKFEDRQSLSNLREEQSLAGPAKIDSVMPVDLVKPGSEIRNMTESTQRRTQYVSDTTDENGVRHIVKADGTQVTIEPSGNGQLKVTVVGNKPEPSAPEQAQKVEAKAAEPREYPKAPDFSHLPLEQRPLNVGSGSCELAAAEMSNFAHTPFTLDGRTFGSVEALYVWLKWSGHPEKQAEAISMFGSEAKKFGKPAISSVADYDGKQIVLGSPEHHALLKRGIEQKLIEHPDLALRFAETYPREIIHDLGHAENPKTRLNARDFSRILTELRQDLVDGKLTTKDGSLAELREKASYEAERRLSKPQMTVPELLNRAGPEHPATERHAIDKYIEAMQGSDKKVTGFVGVGGDSVSMELVDGNIMKISSRTLTERMGNRPFDLPMLERGAIDAGRGPVYWFVQPRAQTPVTYEQLKQFKADLQKRGYVMNDPTENQLGLFHGVVKLLDPYAVQKLD